MGRLPKGLQDLAKEYAENGEYVRMLGELKGKVKIHNHMRFVYGWLVDRDIAVFEYVNFFTGEDSIKANANLFIAGHAQDCRDFQRLENYGVRFHKCSHYKMIKNFLSLGEIGS